LYKAARLSSDEFEQVQKHVDLGVQMLKPVGGPLSRVIPIILAHHDKFDGTGYHETEGEDIPLEARVLSVADVYDALTSDRPYRKAMSPFDAKETIMKASGTDFDPRVVDCFCRVLPTGPDGHSGSDGLTRGTQPVKQASYSRGHLLRRLWGIAGCSFRAA